MKMSRSDLVELFQQLGMFSATNWEPAKLKDRANKLHVVSKEKADKLTKDAQATLFTAQAAIEAADRDWGDPITVTVPKRRKRPRAVDSFPYIRLSDRYGRRLFAWMKKTGIRDRKADWDRLSKSEKEDAVAEGVERAIMFFLKDGEL